MLNVEIAYTSGRKVGLSAQRKADKAWFDFVAGTFGAPNVVPDAASITTPMAERPGPLAGLYVANYGPTPGPSWWDGDFLVGIHDLGPADPTAPQTRPVCVFRFPVPFAFGNALYAAPPFFCF